MATTVLTGRIIRSGSIPATALGGGVISSSTSFATTGSNSFTGNQNINGTVYLTGSLIPSGNFLYDLGSETNSFRDLFISTGSIRFHNPDGTEQGRITVDARSGDISLLKTAGLTNEQKATIGHGNINPNFLTAVSASNLFVQTKIVMPIGGTVNGINLTAFSSSVASTLSNQSAATSSYAINSTIQSQLAGAVSSSTQVKPLLPGDTVSSSGQVLLNTVSGTTFSNSAFYFPLDLRVDGTLTAQQINTEYVSSSVIYESGSTKFGDTTDDVMSVTGSIGVTGQTTLTGNVGVGAAAASHNGLVIGNSVTGNGTAARLVNLSGAAALIASSNNEILSVFTNAINTLTPGAFTGLQFRASIIGAYSVAGFTTPADPIQQDIGVLTGTGATNAYALRIAPPAGATNNYLIAHTTPATFNVTAAGAVTIGGLVTLTSVGQVISMSGSGTTHNFIAGANTGGSFRFGMEGSAGAVLLTSAPAYASIFGTMNATALALGTNGATRAIIDSTGNLGLGVTPSAWGSGTRALDIGGGSALFNPGSTTQTWLLTNAYNDGELFKYKGTGSSAWYQQNGNNHVWYIAPSGTAGNAISFTQAMTLDASGNLGIGTASPATRFHVAQANAKSPTGVMQMLSFDTTSATTGVGGGITFGGYKTSTTNAEYFAAIDGYKENSTGGNAAGALRFHTQVADGSGLVERARIDGSGNLGIGTTNPSASLHVSGTMMIQGVIEKVNITGSAPPTTLNVDAISGSVFYLSGSSANNWTINFRGSTATTLNSIMYPGQSMTFAVLVNHSSVGYTASAHQVDGASITPRWQGGTLPSGSGTSTDMYSYTLIKTANAAFNIFAAQTKFA